ncbi:sensor histidine kinase [Paenibacillus rhizoplanae]|uniref:Sensor histidine kinase n=1 Tax=Paenibacillus rhizoplanae TaxID=1917181 RepID=A0ABW5FCY9_9BACL
MLGLDRDFSFIFMETVLQYGIINHLLKWKKENVKRIWLLPFVMIVDSLFIQFCQVESPLIRTLILIGLLLVIVQTLYQDNILVKIFVVLLTEYILIISDIMASNMLFLVSRMNIGNKIFQVFSLRLPFSIFSIIFMLLLAGMYIRLFNKINFNIPTKYWIRVNLILGIFIFIANYFMIINRIFQNASLQLSWFLIRISIYFFVMSFLITYLFKEICLFYHKEQQRDDLELQNKALEYQLISQEISCLDLKKIRHDIENNLVNIAFLLKENCIEESVEYIQAISATLEATKPVINCGSKYIDSILNYEIAICKKQNIDVRFEIETIPELSIPPTDLSSIISNLLNNSIEANLKVLERERYVQMKMFCYKNYLTIVVENPYNHKLTPAGGLLRTSKKNPRNHGYGLKSVTTSVNNCGGIFKYSYESNVFTSTIIIPIAPIPA